MVRVFLLAGQSNMVGAGVVAELPPSLRAAPDCVRLYEQGQWRELVWRDRFGPEVGFAHELSASLPEDDLVLCKVAQSGANLYYDWNPDRTAGGAEDTYRGPMYPKLLDATREVESLLRAAGEAPRIAVMIWMQGERDSVFDFMARAYEERLKDFIARVRSDLDVPELPFVMAQIAPRVYDLAKGAFNHAHRSVVQESLARVAAGDRHAALVETRDLPQSDNLHFDTAGQLELGRRLARAYLALA